MEETSSGLGYTSHCVHGDVGDFGVDAGAGGGARAMMFVAAVAADATDADDARDGNDENGNDIPFQQSMPPQHQLLPPRPTLPNPFHSVISQQYLNTTGPALPLVPASVALSKNDHPTQQRPDENIDEIGHCINPIEMARAIAMRFQQEALQQQHPSNCTINDTSIPLNINYAQLRHQYFQQERNKLQLFTLKNLEYIMKQEENELRKHVTVMNEMVAYEEQQDIQLQLRQEQQKQYQLTQRHRQEQREIIGIMNEGGGGIGSMEQRRAERARRKRHQNSSTHTSDGRNHHHHHHHHHRASNADAPSSQHGENNNNEMQTSLYLTNLPTDGSTTERTLRSLFGSYGRLDRVTMYRHRDTGMLKGDGLIVFGRDAVEEYHQQRANNHHNHRDGKDEKDGNSNSNIVGDLVKAVCAQVRWHVKIIVSYPNIISSNVPVYNVALLCNYFVVVSTTFTNFTITLLGSGMLHPVTQNLCHISLFLLVHIAL